MKGLFECFINKLQFSKELAQLNFSESKSLSTPYDNPNSQMDIYGKKDRFSFYFSQNGGYLVYYPSNVFENYS